VAQQRLPLFFSIVTFLFLNVYIINIYIQKRKGAFSEGGLQPRRGNKIKQGMSVLCYLIARKEIEALHPFFPPRPSS
jgi:hypothetical protein